MTTFPMRLVRGREEIQFLFASGSDYVERYDGSARKLVLRPAAAEEMRELLNTDWLLRAV
jgi:hypothetical protein